jgi:hypothetical protein
LGGGAGKLDDGVDGNTKEQQTNKTTYKKREKNQTKQQGSKEKTETRKGEKERQSLSFLPDKATQGGRRTPLRRRLKKKKKLGFFQGFSL